MHGMRTQDAPQYREKDRSDHGARHHNEITPESPLRWATGFLATEGLRAWEILTNSAWAEEDGGFFTIFRCDTCGVAIACWMSDEEYEVREGKLVWVGLRMAPTYQYLHCLGDCPGKAFFAGEGPFYGAGSWRKEPDEEDES